MLHPNRTDVYGTSTDSVRYLNWDRNTMAILRIILQSVKSRRYGPKPTFRRTSRIDPELDGGVRRVPICMVSGRNTSTEKDNKRHIPQIR